MGPFEANSEPSAGKPAKKLADMAGPNHGGATCYQVRRAREDSEVPLAVGDARPSCANT